ncbi:hypothetical protein Sinme_0148 [Sinorhizobium meliloti AK83]|nr:hypothetical protein Sinme_0148 [Sinorhizobium meliloti AK83]SEJ25877.1 hypothetical protein SAMN04244575_03671 [Sinorhizobium meliloti]
MILGWIAGRIGWTGQTENLKPVAERLDRNLDEAEMRYREVLRREIAPVIISDDTNAIAHCLLVSLGPGQMDHHSTGCELTGHQMARPTFEDVTAGLKTKSDKIRALANAGYLRTEISSLLGIRYQHVRKVLVDAGITEGLQKEVQLEREPVVLEIEEQNGATPAEPTSWEVLLRAGFHFLGEWKPEDEGFQLDATAPADKGVYAFIVDDIVMYVGLTQRGLRGRLNAYRRGHEKQRTNARVKTLILEALSSGKRVKVLVATPQESSWNGIPVDTAAGLEAGLIAMIQPKWNILGVG